jgi:ABC-type dipeptide/oligopeptide/nickel transport system permease component
MNAWLLRRLLLLLPTLLGVATAVFLLVHLIPGDPAALMLGEGARGEDVAALRAKLGLDRPLGEQYARYLKNLASGDAGESFRYERPVASLVAERFGATAQLGLASLALASLLALALASAGILLRRPEAEAAAAGFSILAVSLPSFGLGPLLLYVFSLRWNLLPVGGRGGPEHLLLPALTLGLAFSAVLGRVLRASLKEALAEDYVRAARARGASPRRALLVHAMRNALLPAVTLMGLQTGSLLTGAIITEAVFAWPGLGRLLFQAIQFRDYPLVQGLVLFMALVYVLVNLGVDLLYAALDPRVRAGFGAEAPA